MATTATATAPLTLAPPETRVRPASALLTLARRRAMLTSRTPRQIAVPLLGPALLALILAPALKKATGGLHSHIDYTSFVGVGAVGLVIPLSCVFAGLSVLVDRHSGAQRELLAAPVGRAYLVLGNMLVAIVLSALQALVVVGLSALRGGSFHITGAGVAWFLAAALLFTVFMYGLAETVASRVHKEEDYVGATPVLAILPFFFAGALFPISAMPAALTTIAKLLPLTHALALMRYGFVDPSGRGLHDIWGMGNATTEAWLSLGVVALFAAALVTISVRVFARSAVA
ncbi:MAG TPA: ABC transporter permease [Solirubrobacteraceae bacterium]|nr:ABC transporter permease [Solirubrobacteraceae bacterium]